MQSEESNLIEARIRAEVREELEHEFELEQSSVEDRERRLIALCLQVALLVGMAVPILGLVVGLTVRAFLWAAYHPWW